MELLGFFAYPLLACILLVLIHTYFGIHILERGIIFVDLALAQFIGVGIAVSFLLGYDGNEKYVFSVLFAGFGAYILAHSRRIARVTNIEAFIGVLYIFSLAAAMLILDRTPHGLEEFKMILNGSILWVGPKDLIATSLLYAAIGLFQFFFRARFFDLSYKGQGRFFWEFLFFLSFALVLVKSVEMAGILQVFAFLIIPALIGRLFTHQPAKILIGGWLLGFAASGAGIMMSYVWDLPTAPVIVASLSVLFLVIIVVRLIMNEGKNRGQIETKKISS
ncbi:MAG TPA: metal ABC transporter permease [Syntrophales bacterium]|nr:metal ABC transporter permease [Syntrophales bacterium]